MFKNVSYVRYASIKNFYGSYGLVKWLFSFDKTQFSSKYKYLRLRIFGFEFDGLASYK